MGSTLIGAILFKGPTHGEAYELGSTLIGAILFKGPTHREAYELFRFS